MADGGLAPVPILVYHSVSAVSSEWLQPYTVAPESFRDQLDLLVDGGWRSLTVSELVTLRQRDPRGVPDRSVVLTFDDGYADFVDVALPLLRERNLRSTVYVTTGFLRGGEQAAALPDDPTLDRSQLRSLADEGVELGAHSHTHPHLDTCPRRRAQAEITRSRDILEDIAQRRVDSFAYPHGYSSAAVRRLVAAAGFRSACGVGNALSPPDDDVFRLARLMLRSTTSLDTFGEWLVGSNCPVAGTTEALRTRLWRLWRRGRAVVRGRPGSEIPRQDPDGVTFGA